MLTFGLTGGIACGKSTVTKTLKAANIPVVDADLVAREIVEIGKPAWQQIRDRYGDEYLNQDQTLNRTKLGELVFNDKEALHDMNVIMGEAITVEADRQLNAFHQAGHVVTVYDAALICEMGNAKKYMPLIVVHCKPEQQLERLMKRNNLTEDQAMARINAQMSVKDKKALANYLIDTSGTIEQSISQTEYIINIMKNQK